jgi:hypothetical protein
MSVMRLDVTMVQEFALIAASVRQGAIDGVTGLVAPFADALIKFGHNRYWPKRGTCGTL